MKYVFLGTTLGLILSTAPAPAEEPLDVAGTYQRIKADHQRISATQNRAAISAADRFAQDAYRLLIQQAEGAEKLDADDLHALGQCHEALGKSEEAIELYTKSLAAAPLARTHLSLARMSLQDDLKAADTHFENAVKLDPAYPDLPRFRLALAAAHQRQRDWNGAVPYLEHLLGYTKTLAERTPASASLQVSHDAVQKQLDRTRRFAGMTGNAAPDLKAQQWAQGEPVGLGALKGKVVLVDFCAMWAAPSRERMELLKKLQQDGVEIIGVTLAYQHKYDAEMDRVVTVDDLAAEDEAAGLASFAKKHEIPWRLALIGQETIDEYGVASLPHTVAIDKSGNVKTILFGGEIAAEDLKSVVKELLK